MKIKAALYQAHLGLLRLYWALSGRRRVAAFGHKYDFMPETVIPTSRTLRLPKDDCKSRIVRYTDYVQMHSVHEYVSQLTKNPTIIDVGAHHGVYAVFLGELARQKGGKVIAVEPNPQAFEIMLKNVRLNGLQGTVVCENVAILDRPGKVSLRLHGSETSVTSDRLGPTVEAVTLTEVIDRQGVKHVDVLMIDVEGAELPVLRGFPWGSVEIGRVMCELHPYAWGEFGYSGEEMLEFVCQQGYRCLDMYLREYTRFDGEAYIGPTVLLPAVGQSHTV